jgi:methionyl-tRNA synthetase
MLGYDDVIAGSLDFREVDEGDARHVVLTGDYESWSGSWEPSSLPAGQALREPRPLFAKLDPDRVVAEELARMEAAATA